MAADVLGKKISELEETTDLAGLFTIGSDKNNQSKKVPLQFVKEAADYANAQGDYAKGVGDTIQGNTGVNEYPAFSSSTQYAAGSVVRYNNKLYRFTALHPAGAWVGTDAIETSIKAETDVKLTELESEFGVAKSGNEAVTIPLYSIKAGSKVAISIDGDDDIFPVGVFAVSEDGASERIYYIYKDSELRYYAEYVKSNDNVLKLSVNASKNKLFSVSLATQSASIETMKTIAKLKQKGNELTSSRSYGLFTNGALNSIIKEVALKNDFDISTIKSVVVRRAYEINPYFYNNIYLYADSTIVLYEKAYSTKEEALQDAELKYYARGSAYVLADFSKVNEGETSFTTKVNYPLTIDNSPILHSLLNSTQLHELEDTLYQKSINLFNKDSQLIKNGYWGGSAFIENAIYRITHPIFLESGIKYKCIPFNLGNNPLVAQVNESNESIAFFNAVLSNGIILFTPTQSGYYSFNIGASGGLNGFIVAKENEYPSEYVPYVSRIKDGLVDKESTTFWKKEKSVNLFDKNNSLVASGYWQSSSLVEYATIYHTHPIFLEKNTEYKLPFAKGTLGSNDSVVLVDVNNNPQREFKLIINGETATFTPTESGYYSFNIGGKIHIDTFMVTKASEYPSEYVPYYDFWSLPDLRLKKENLLPDIVTNVLYGKSVAFDGDSICEGAGFKGGYGKIIAERNNMIYQNRGISGGTITAETYSSSTGAARHWICRDIQNLNQDADYVILEGGVNDASLNGKLGEVTDGYNAELDDTTFCGAFESMIKQCYQRFPSAKLGFIIVHRMTPNYNPGGSFYEKAVEILKKWAVPYIDLSLLVPPLNYIQSLKEVYTNAADGWHPNELGYKTFYCDKIEEWMKTL